MAKMFYDTDADLNILKNKTVAIVGYGIQGRGQGLNLRDSGVNVIIAQRPGGKNYELAVEDGFKPVSVEEAAQKADIIQILTQDHLQAEIYEKSIAPFMKTGKTLMFSHGFNIHFGYIKPPKEIDVIMVAPKGPGALVRTQFLAGGGVPALAAVYQNASGKALETALAYAKAIGGTRGGVIETSFKEETETDLFGEQAVLCGGLSELIRAGYETLVEAGYQPEMAYFECQHEVKLIVDAIFAEGISGMHRRVSDTAEYGDYSRGKRIITSESRAAMKQILKEVQSGQFAKEWISENKNGRPNYNKFRTECDQHPIEKLGSQLRGMMKWIQGGQSLDHKAKKSKEKVQGSV